MNDALKYLDTRVEFWRQQKPVYTHKKDQRKIIAKAINLRNQAHIEEKAKEAQNRLKEKEKKAQVHTTESSAPRKESFQPRKESSATKQTKFTM